MFQIPQIHLENRNDISARYDTSASPQFPKRLSHDRACLPWFQLLSPSPYDGRGSRHRVVENRNTIREYWRFKPVIGVAKQLHKNIQGPKLQVEGADIFLHRYVPKAVRKLWGLFFAFFHFYLHNFSSIPGCSSSWTTCIALAIGL